MKKYSKFYFVVILMLLISPVMAQKTSAELEAERLERLMLNRVRFLTDSLKQYLPADIEEEETVKTFIKFPAPRPDLIGKLPKGILSDRALTEYLNKLGEVYSEALGIETVQRTKAAKLLSKGNGEKIGALSITAYTKGDRAFSTLMAIEACKADPKNVLALNNLSALLNLRGAHFLSLPILKTLESSHPENPMILNNLGQALAGTGQIDSAMRTLSKAIKKSPEHPEANNTAGQIEMSKGNIESAKNFFKNSLMGAYNEGASNNLKRLQEKERNYSMPITDFPVEMPYFNEFKYQLPRQCSGPADAPYIQQEHNDFVEFIGRMMTAYSELARGEKELGEGYLNKKMTQMISVLQSGGVNSASPWESMMSPLKLMAMKKSADFALTLGTHYLPDHLAKVEGLTMAKDQLIADYEEKVKKIQEYYGAQKSKYDCGEGNGKGCEMIDKLSREECQKLVALANTDQAIVSAAVTAIQKERLRFMRWEFAQTTYYGYMTATDPHSAKSSFYSACSKYLNELAHLADRPFVIAGKTCDNDQWPSILAKNEKDKTKEAECPINIEIPFIVGKFKLNCEELEFEGGEGAVFKVNKNFKTMQTTMSLGAGVQFQQGRDWGVFGVGVEASADQSFYITWDGKNNLTDFGMAIKVSAEIKNKNTLPNEKLNTELIKDWQNANKGKIELGYTIGVNSGWTFSDAPVLEGIKMGKAVIEKYFPATKKK